MAKKRGGAFYAVHKGHNPGIYTSWDEVEPQVRGYANAKHKKFSVLKDAQHYLKTGEDPLSLMSNNSSGDSSGATSSRIDKGKKRAAPEDTDNAEGDYIVVYSDGACENNQTAEIAKAGIGVWWGHGDSRNCSKRCPGRQTNNRGELLAVHHILDTAPVSQRPLKIKTDSKYTIDCLTKWMPGWRRRGWLNAAKQPVANKEIVQLIDAQLRFREFSGQKVELEYVAAHVGIEGNEAADSLAKAGCYLPIPPEPKWDELRESIEKQMAARRKVSPWTSIPVAATRENETPLPAESRAASSHSPLKIRRIEVPNKASSPAAAPSGGVRMVVEVDPSPRELEDYADCLGDSDEEESHAQESPQAPGPSHPLDTLTRPQANENSSQLSMSAGNIELTQEEWEEYASCLVENDDLAAELSD